MNATQIISLARRYLGTANESSARICLADAIKLQNAGDIASARSRALKSLQYSVGIFHSDYQRACK